MARPAKDAKKEEGGDKLITVNSKAYHDYTIVDSMEAGLVLTGTEIKSIRAGRVNIREAFARVESDEVFLHNAHIATYAEGNRWNHEPTRTRKLLLHKRQIADLRQRTKGKGLTLVPLRLYITRDRAKIQLALAQGKKEYDKRQSLAAKEAARDIERAVRVRR